MLVSVIPDRESECSRLKASQAKMAEENFLLKERIKLHSKQVFAYRTVV